MLISFNWLKEFVRLPDSVTASEVAEKLKFSTVEVEGLIELGASLRNVVAGKVTACEKHPNADKLKVCRVDIGSETVQIVCGGSNVAAGMMVAAAKVGAKVKWHGEGDLVELLAQQVAGAAFRQLPRRPLQVRRRQPGMEARIEIGLAVPQGKLTEVPAEQAPQGRFRPGIRHESPFS